MSDIVGRTKVRIRKLLWVLLLIPIVSGGVSYFLAAQQPATHTATAEIMLGNFQDTNLTNGKKVERLFQSDKFIKELTATDKTYPGLTAKLSELSLVISLTGENKGKVEKNVKVIVDNFMQKSEEGYNAKADSLQSQINQMKQENLVGDSYYELNKELNDLVKTQVLEETQVVTSDVNAVKRGLFGLLVGLMLNLFILAVPEIIRD